MPTTTKIMVSPCLCFFFIIIIFYTCAVACIAIIRVIRRAVIRRRAIGRCEKYRNKHTHVQGEGGVFNGTSTEAEGNICGHQTAYKRSPPYSNSLGASLDAQALKRTLLIQGFQQQSSLTFQDACVLCSPPTSTQKVKQVAH